MTATGSRAASPVSSSHSALSQRCSAWPYLCCPHKRKEKLCQTDLPLRSAPGVWLLVGVGVVLVGMSVAVAGYVSSAPKPLAGRGSSHTERMKLAGPVVMGVGLFIFICAATLLYENRDRKLFKLETGGDLEDSMSDMEGALLGREPGCSCREWRDSKDMASWGSASLTPSLCDDNPGSPPTARRGHNIITVVSALDGQGQGPTGEPEGREEHGGLDGHQAEDTAAEAEEVGEGGPRILTCVVHHQEPTSHAISPGTSSLHSAKDSVSCNSSEIDFNVRTVLTPPVD